MRCPACVAVYPAGPSTRTMWRYKRRWSCLHVSSVVARSSHPTHLTKTRRAYERGQHAAKRWRGAAACWTCCCAPLCSCWRALLAAPTAAPFQRRRHERICVSRWGCAASQACFVRCSPPAADCQAPCKGGLREGTPPLLAPPLRRARVRAPPHLQQTYVALGNSTSLPSCILVIRPASAVAQLQYRDAMRDRKGALQRGRRPPMSPPAQPAQQAQQGAVD